MDVSTYQTHVSFPELSKKEILDCLAEMGISLEADELNEPHRFKDKIKSLFLTMVGYDPIGSSHQSKIGE